MGKFIFIPSFFYSRESAYLYPMQETDQKHVWMAPTFLLEHYSHQDPQRIFAIWLFGLLRKHCKPVIKSVDEAKDAVKHLRLPDDYIAESIDWLVEKKLIGKSGAGALFLRGSDFMIKLENCETKVGLVRIPTEVFDNFDDFDQWVYEFRHQEKA